jgi:dUTP pyrophosphatase
LQTVDVKIKIIAEEKEKFMPRYATNGSAAADLFADIKETYLLKAGGRCLIPTGVAIALPGEDYVALIFARSGLSIKKGICLSNGVGVIDSDYRGEIKVGLVNLSAEDYEILPGDKIAQIAVLPLFQANFIPSAALDETSRGEGGFGSTGR